MKIIKIIPFILLFVGTIGLLIIEFTSGSRYLVLTFAGLNVLGLILFAFTQKKS